MSRIKLMEPEQLDTRQRQQYERFPANLTLGLLLMDQRLSEALPNLANALRASALAPKLREAAIVRVAVLHNSEYELKQHSREVIKAGWSEAEVADIKSGNWSGLPRAAAAVLAFVDQAVETGHVDDYTFARVQAVLAPPEIATLLLLVGHYMMVARFTAILEIGVDAEADGFTNEH